MEEYINKLLEQIRFKKAHKSIADEIRSHIEDQIEDNMTVGMDRETAERAAVVDMGDPVEAGISLDRIHRPQIAWSMLLGVVVVGIIGSIIHLLIIQHSTLVCNTCFVYGSEGYIRYTILGIILMLLVYMLDYTTIARYSKIASIMLFVLLIATERMRVSINGSTVFLCIGPITILTTAIMMLYIPLYGGIIYKYKGGKIGALIKSLLWIIIPCGFCLYDQSLSIAIVMAICLLSQLTIAIIKGWINVPKIPTIIGIWLVFILSPVLVVLRLLLLSSKAGYQIARLKSILNVDSEFNYLTRTVREITRSSGILGGRPESVFSLVPNIDSDYILTYITSTWGVVALLAVTIAVGGIIIAGFISLSKSKNQLGLVMGSGCLMALLVNAIINMCSAFGIIPYIASFFPFISAGGSNLLVSYVFLGIILCIYKYKNAYPQHVDIRIRGKKKYSKNLI